MTMQSKKQFENQSQSGRSMVEMLGVLAIIAILSIGGIVGYKLAMNYYQADQIANEINLMRNDLKVKYALGNEELLLGDPYDETPDDENYSGHLSTQYDRYPVDYDCIIRGNKESKNELYNCREADAYYIAVGNISKGVCKPLTTLVNGMDGLMYMEINKEVYEKYDLCTSDEANEIYIEFDAEEVNGNYDSNRPEGWCAKDDDCPDEKPFCENERCVECLDDLDCESNTQHCENNECISCPEGKIWSGTACVDCMTDTDCADTFDTPICKTDEHICVECETDEDCLAKGTENPICNTTEGKCEPCPAETPLWYNNKCVECLTYEDCTNPDEPKCDESTNTCEACPQNSFWDGEKCQEGCRENNHCAEDEYCYKIKGASCENEWEDEEDFSGSCRKVEGDLIHGTVNGKTYYGSNNTMNWWSAERFCEAANRLGHGNGQMVVWNTLDFKCNPPISPDATKIQYCYKNGDDNITVHLDNLSSTVNELRSMFGVTRKDDDYDMQNIDIWLERNSSPCGVFEMVLGQKEGTIIEGTEIKGKGGRIHLANPHGDMADHALCQP